jgi:enoyl-CoA hydratase/carnithine racemase
MRRRSERDRAQPPVLYDLLDDGRVAVVTLNRPERLNAYDVTMRDGLYEALLAVHDDPGVRAMVLRGNGRAFCTGGDVAEFGSAPSPIRAREVRWLRDVWGALRRVPVITIAAVHGYAVGGGFEMALLCDQCIASPEARFALPETGLGMIPGVAGTQTLPRLVGTNRALRLVLAGEELGARAARELGLVSRIVPRTRLLGAALTVARTVARIDRDLVTRLKRSLNDGLDRPLTHSLALEQVLNPRTRESSNL